MKTQKTYWQTLVERGIRNLSFGFGKSPASVTGGTPIPPRPAMDVDENDRVLAQVNESEPLYRVLLNYAYTHTENNMAIAFDPARSIDDRRDFTSRAAGVAAFIADVETTRIRLREDILQKQKMESLRTATAKK